ncbi:MAG: DUF87 domain-containing protein [Candidatus Nezhaarchaeota archaeon]|nr:DUF87 domain-containing protein [Candidatus Nezhaarchaeota archaeon]
MKVLPDLIAEAMLIRLDPHLVIFLAILMLTIMLRIKLTSQGKILLGVRYFFVPFYLDLREAKHIVIFGITGSGKTNTARLIVRSFRGSKLIIDWNGEYLLGKVARPSELSISHLSILDFCEALASSLQLTAPQYAMLLEVARDSSNLSEMIEKLRKYPTESDTRREIKNALLRRLEPLSYANLFSGSLTIDDIDTIDLSGLTFDAKRLVANVVLRLIYNNPTKQLLVLEEAQNLLIPRRPDQPPTSCELILDEIRKHGVRVLAIAQIPSLVSTTYRNAEYVIIHRLSLTAEEARDIGLTEEERRRIAKLPNGSCVIISKGQKVTIRVLKVKSLEPKSKVTKCQVEAQHMKTTQSVEKVSFDPSLMSYVIEDLKELNEWRKETANNVNMLMKEVDEIKQLTKTFLDKLSLLEAQMINAPSTIKNLKIEVDKMRIDLIKRVEGLEYSLGFIKERLSEIEEILFKSFKV